jgi:ribonuclease BN (tRNA processing enzyme)
VLVIADGGKKMLIDCGGDVRFALWQQGLTYNDIDAVYVSHLHADHIGGMEFLSFCRLFDKRAGGPPTLFMVYTLMTEMWEDSLKGGLESIEGQVMTLTGYFKCYPVRINESFTWEGIEFTPIQTVHVMAGYKIKNSYGLLIRKGSEVARPDMPPKYDVFFTSDTQNCPAQLSKFYARSKLILHDCETGFKSGVHANFDELKNLPKETKSKMWLYHYQPNSKQDAKAEGFAGFIKKGQEFEI